MERYPCPKVDLHLHLDGSILPETAWELASARGVPVPGGSVEGYRNFIRTAANCGSVNEYLKLFDLPLQIMRDRDSIIRITRELIETLSGQGLAYAEIRFAPQLHARQGLAQRQAVEAVLEGRRQGLERCPGIRVGILTCMMCVGPETANWDANAETVEVCRAYLGKGVVGLDLARGAGDDPDLCRRAVQEGVTLEICPTSNIQCRTQPSYGAHPAKKLLDMGISVTINTDNMVLAGVSLDDEYDHCLRDMGFVRDDLIRMNENAVRAAFLPEADKADLLARLEACR